MFEFRKVPRAKESMRMHSTDADVRKYDATDEYQSCPECLTYMLPLKEYEISRSGEAPDIGAEPWEFLLFGWMAVVYNYVYDRLTLESRCSRLTKIKEETLPEFPRSLICPKCLHVMRKR